MLCSAMHRPLVSTEVITPKYSQPSMIAINEIRMLRINVKKYTYASSPEVVKVQVHLEMRR